MRWLVLRVEGIMDNARVARAIHSAADRTGLAPKLGASGLDRDQLRDQVRIFDGELHYRCSSERVVLSMLLHDARRVAADDSTVVRLWVH
jgi:hypothetical protein